MIYDDIDMKNSYNTGFWVGALSGVVGTLMICFAIGIYFNS